MMFWSENDISLVCRLMNLIMNNSVGMGPLSPSRVELHNLVFQIPSGRVTERKFSLISTIYNNQLLDRIGLKLCSRTGKYIFLKDFDSVFQIVALNLPTHIRTLLSIGLFFQWLKFSTSYLNV